MTADDARGGPPRAAELRGAGASTVELLEPHRSLGVAVPAYAGRSLPNLAASIVRAIGGEPSALALPPLEARLDPFDGRRADGPVLLFVVDGLGLERLRDAAARAGALGASTWLRHCAPITSVFPTTTTVALASLSTASSPSRHGLVGYRQYLPAFGAVVDMLRMSPLGVAQDEALVGPAWSSSSVIAAPTIFRGSVAGAVAVSRDRFEGHAFTRMIYDGAAYEPYSAFADLAASLVHLLGREPPPPLVVAYWDELDTVQHLRGPAAPWAELEIARLADLLGFVASALTPARARQTTAIVTADHGLVPLEPSRQTAFDAAPEIMAHLARPPTGDRRVGLLKARAGEVAALERAVLERLPAGARSLSADEAIRAGLFGPPPYHPELEERVGDLVVLVPSPGGITYALPGRSPARRHLLGGHGGLEPSELLVPLVAAPLAELRGEAPRG